MLRPKVVAAIDFGTYGSGYAWAVISDQNQNPRTRQIKTRTQWIAQPVASAKNLTALLLSSSGDEVEAWGFEAKQLSTNNPNSPIILAQGFKMKLIDAPLDIPTTSSATVSVDKLISLYLKEIYNLALADIQNSGYKSEEIRWCLTVPAIWNDYQKQVMRKAAIEAGLPDDEKMLIFVLEPEAAAHYARIAGVRTLGATGGRRANLLSPGSRFMIADCGGGPVDITAYRTDSQGKLVEIGRDFGGAFGSEYLNKVFLDEYLSIKLGPYDALAEIAAQKPSAFAELLAGWERAKLNVKLDQSSKVFISIPAGIDRLLPDEVRRSLAETQEDVDDHLVLTRIEIEKIFESVVPDVITLIDKQLVEMAKSAPTAKAPLIILVGGFGSSPYLQERIVRHVGDRAQVLVPPEPSVAVLYGAAHFAYDPQTRARRSKFTYGCKIASPFRPGIDPETKSFEGPDGDELCSDRFDKFVTAGQTVGTDEEVQRVYHPIWDYQKEISVVICRTRDTNPQYTDEREVSEVGEILVNFEKAMKLPAQQRPAQVSMFFGDTEVRVKALVPETGETVEARLEFDATVGL